MNGKDNRRWIHRMAITALIGLATGGMPDQIHAQLPVQVGVRTGAAIPAGSLADISATGPMAALTLHAELNSRWSLRADLAASLMKDGPGFGEFHGPASNFVDAHVGPELTLLEGGHRSVSVSAHLGAGVTRWEMNSFRFRNEAGEQRFGMVDSHWEPSASAGLSVRYPVGDRLSLDLNAGAAVISTQPHWRDQIAPLIGEDRSADRLWRFPMTVGVSYDVGAISFER